MEEQRRKELEETLIGWAVEALGRWTGMSSPPASLPDRSAQWLSHYGRILSRDWHPDGRGERLLSILSLVKPPKVEAVQQVFVPARPLSLETILPDDDRQTSATDLWQAFVGEFGRLPEGEGRFETFIHLFRKYAWSVPCTYGEAGVSLYDEFKALAALMYASGGTEAPAEEFLLVGGDIPGIQDFVYTITSKGAAKGLRGRSFFLQLLGDAVVRALRRELGRLPETNVIYAAGGNFMLLVPAGSEAVLEEWQAGFNRSLLKEFEGDLYLALAWETLPSSVVGTSEFAAARERLGARVAAAKSRRFVEVVQRDGWSALFRPQGKGGLDYCHICQREPRPGEKLVAETTEAGEEVRKCGLCRSFEALARDIAYDPLWMVVAAADDAARQDSGWPRLLARLTGFAYRFEHDPPRVEDGEAAYIFNHTDLESVHGFRFLANVTPRIGAADRRWVQEHYPDLVVPPGERIKDFGLMARQSEGIQRVGVLRMDVDNLGLIFGRYLRGSMAQTSALSAALELFFAGHLNRICRDVAAQGEHDNSIYVIYAGGDDLFVVGSWDRMPILAERIRGDFAAYTGHNPHLTLSGGVTLEERKFPLYRAAERAGEAEGKAKQYTRDGCEKDAFCFLGQVVAWGEEWELLRETERSFSSLVDAGVPRSLLRVAQILHTQFIDTRRRALKAEREAGQEPTLRRLYWGRWVWMAAYSLTRLARGCPKEQKEEILKIQREWIEPGKRIHFLGLAARWAEYKLRGGEK
ncbi:MAG: type III-A CRISPR-associated protein Cas10/Csm1 [Chloroflexota bacterium]|nr:MAG: type III-A CRISPR-associated protein Cas10/Csm1 [Chloroflexota bacterium]